jgi:formin 2
LEIGNFLNAKTPRGDAFGYTLNSLTKLVDTKSTDLTMNLMQYLVSLLQKNARELSYFYDDLPNVPAASKVTLPAIAESMKILTTDFTNVKKAVEALVDNDKFKKQMTVSSQVVIDLTNERNSYLK